MRFYNWWDICLSFQSLLMRKLELVWALLMMMDIYGSRESSPAQCSERIEQMVRRYVK